MAAIICRCQLQIKKDFNGSPCGSHERPTAFAAVLIAVLLMAVFPCSRCLAGLDERKSELCPESHHERHPKQI